MIWLLKKKFLDTWYGMIENGVAITRDAGKTWKIGNEGLHIPDVKSIFCSRYGNALYIGTPAGVYEQERGRILGGHLVDPSGYRCTQG